MNSKTTIGRECIQCEENTLLTCSKCFKPLCKKCGFPKEPILLPIYNKTIPERLCEKCRFDLVPELLNETVDIFNSLIGSIRKIFE